MSSADGTGSEESPASDAELIAASARDPDRFGEFYDRHVDAMLRFHFQRTGCAQTAADLAAETFAEAFASRRRFRDTGAPGRAWLFKIARRQLARFVRRQRVATRARRRLGVETEVVLIDDDVERIESLADFGPVRDALRDLPAALGEAVWLRVGEGLAYSEVAARLGCSEGAARVRVSRGLAQLADAVDGGAP